ncbi:MAG: transcription antitermination factor NusB [Chloroflexota bacterium]|nr:transcription antitermination factor NusB [Chloroflexota bacterium]
MKIRRSARIAALQALFEADVAHHDAQGALQARLDETPLPEEAVRFASSLVHGTLANLAVLDESIRQMAPHWPLDQMSRIDVCILRLAIYELSVSKDVPVKVVINEAVELAKLFGSDSSGRFVNGVLGSVAKSQQQIPLTQPEDLPT